jgi:hypothetical protein
MSEGNRRVIKIVGAPSGRLFGWPQLPRSRRGGLTARSLAVQLAILLITSVCILADGAGRRASAQSPRTLGAIEGTVTNSHLRAISEATVVLQNLVTHYMHRTSTDESGLFWIAGVPQNGYQLTVSANGFGTVRRSVVVRSGVPLSLQVPLAAAGSQGSLSVRPVGTPDGVLESPWAKMHRDFPTAQVIRPTLPPSHFNFDLNCWELDDGWDELAEADPSAHSDLDRRLFELLPALPARKLRHRRTTRRMHRNQRRR